MSQPLTVGQLAAELALYHPDTPVEVYVPGGADSYRVLPIVSAGLGEALPDEVFGSSLPLRAQSLLEHLPAPEPTSPRPPGSS